MARPKKETPSIEKRICFPADIAAKVDLLLHSPLEGKVPHAAWQRYLCRLIDQDLKRKASSHKALLELEEKLSWAKRDSIVYGPDVVEALIAYFTRIGDVDDVLVVSKIRGIV